MSKRIQGFIPSPPPNVTHNDLTIRFKDTGIKRRPFIGKSDRLKSEEDRLRPYIAKLRPLAPLSGALRLTWKLIWPVDARHASGEPKTTKPDADNVVKTLNDLLESCRIIANDAQICDLRVVKAYGEPAGIYVRIEEVKP